MMILRHCQSLTAIFVTLFAIVASAFSESAFLQEPKIDENDGAIPFPTSALKPLQVVDCVMEKCTWLSSPKDKRLCTYLLCLGGAKSLAARLESQDPARDSRKVSSVPHDLDRESLRQYTDDYETSDMTSPQDMDMTRSKKWQYPDPLQHCVQTRCTGQRGVDFYTCVYKNCIAGKMAMNFMAV